MTRPHTAWRPIAAVLRREGVYAYVRLACDHETRVYINRAGLGRATRCQLCPLWPRVYREVVDLLPSRHHPRQTAVLLPCHHLQQTGQYTRVGDVISCEHCVVSLAGRDASMAY